MVKAQIILIVIAVLLATNILPLSAKTNLANAAVICVDKYNSASVIPCSDQNAIAAQGAGNLTPAGNMSGNMTASGGNMTQPTPGQIYTQSFSPGTLDCAQHPGNTAVITFNNTEWQISAPPSYASFGPISKVVGPIYNSTTNNSHFTIQGGESNNEGHCAIGSDNTLKNVAVTISGTCGNNASIWFDTTTPYSVSAEQNGTFTGNVVCPTTMVPSPSPLPSPQSPTQGTFEAACVQYHDKLGKTVDDCHRMFNGNTILEPGAYAIACNIALIAGSFLAHVGPILDILLHC
jgi:hypothetical protein